MINIKKQPKALNLLVITITSLLLSACGSDSDDSNKAPEPTVPVPTPVVNIINTNAGGPDGNKGDCDAVTEGINWNALMTETCRKLSDYNLFQDSMNPTENPTNGGVAFNLAVPLFTDYATKYRFAFIPEGKQIKYTQDEVLDFPIGTAIVKTFTMPTDTADRDGEELIIETRLLIRRDNGWVARPYYWADTTDAKIAITGKNIENMTTTHKGELKTFNYSVPKASDCTSCHSVVPLSQGPDDTRQPIFKPLGPKARNLNFDHVYADTTANQLQYLADNQVLTGLPSDLSTIDKIEQYSDFDDIETLPHDQVMNTARSYLDNNCAHCHRSELTLPEDNYAGPAGGSGLQMEYNRDYAENPQRFGTCKVAVAGGHEDYPADVIPGSPEDSYLLFRMNTNIQRHRMPELGRSTIHSEGVDLISYWIKNLPTADCSNP
ncbi:MAG: SO2930 family diheme c-type cytochrome [Cognaticolwellia sp.]